MRGEKTETAGEEKIKNLTLLYILMCFEYIRRTELRVFKNFGSASEARIHGTLICSSARPDFTSI